MYGSSILFLGFLVLPIFAVPLTDSTVRLILHVHVEFTLTRVPDSAEECCARTKRRLCRSH